LSGLTTDDIERSNSANAKESKSKKAYSSDGVKQTPLRAVGREFQELKGMKSSSGVLHRHGNPRSGEAKVIEPMHPSQITRNKSLISNGHDLRFNQMKRMKTSPGRFLKMAKTAAMQSKKEWQGRIGLNCIQMTEMVQYPPYLL